MPTREGATPERSAYRPRHRLQHDRQYQAVYGAKVRKAAGPLIVFTLPNDLDHPRLGLSVGRRVGPAVRRARVKRMLRESFRLDAAELPPALDLVVGVRPHAPMPLESYRRLLMKLAWEGRREWDRRARRRAGDEWGEAGGPA